MELISDVVVDTLRLIPFLFLTYVLLTYVEQKDARRFHRLIQRYKYLGPSIGAILGVIPQCGFSVMAACLYLNSSISIGTLIAVFFSTSDEAIPMLLARPQSFDLLWKLLIAKVIFGMLIGYLIDLLTRFHFHQDKRDRFVEDVHCHHFWQEVIQRTLSVTVYIFIFSLLLSFIMEQFTAESISLFMENLGWLQPVLCALIGFIPNCASSVLLCELFFHGFIGAGALFCGLCCNAGLGFMILLRSQSWKTVFFCAAVLFVSALCGCLLF